MAELPLDFDIGLQKTCLEGLVWSSSYNKDLRARFLYQWLNTVVCDDTQLTMVFTAFSVAGIGRCRRNWSVSQVVFSVASLLLFSVSHLVFTVARRDSQVLASAVRHGLVRGGYTDVHGNERYCAPYDACK
ncbi:unnamed protein product [Penicillium nalgiovense]|uniref:Uncharacterized protein n=1 Tax=Penicillium nalgiovense TaxID=60175 RepID=A0A9W4ITQ3_PENNA|nr:unnamed protein product [Penicillium nalgiovense]CAG7949421.1 unnamed protein product [Penicillium nalgiovense]CAG8001155.1 unnamed protein product [Penicillium nalgiovense]CAG8007061.1 unnamed protein product [Penicillium nalgiovense]CAG8016141.1 unnamed protein product [Penicillium nalgiovense]